MGAGNILLVVMMIAVALVLIAGIFLMARGGEANRRYGNKLMTLRVVLQAGVFVLLGVLFLMSKSS